MTDPTLYPLSQTQLLNLWSQTFSTHKQLNNIATSLLVEAPLDLDALMGAVKQAIARNDSFGIRITRRARRQQQYFGVRGVLALETVDFLGRTDADLQAFFDKVARTPLPVYDSALAKVYVVRAPDGACGLFTCISHFAMDTWGIHLFYRDVFGLYFAGVEGDTPPEAPLPFEDMVRREASYPGSARARGDLEFWRAELASFEGRVPAYTDVVGTRNRDAWRKVLRKPDHPFGRSVYLRTTARHETLAVEPADAAAVAAFCAEHRTPLQLVFLIALRTFLARVSGSVDDVTLYATFARRGTLLEKRTGGDRATGLPLRTILGHDRTFLEALQAVADKQNSILKHADVDYLEVAKLQGEAYGVKKFENSGPVVFGYANVSIDLGRDLRYRFDWHCAGATHTILYLMLLGPMGDGSLRLCFEYMDRQVSPETLRQCHAFMLQVIRAGIADPGITMGELLALPLPA